MSEQTYLLWIVCQFQKVRFRIQQKKQRDRRKYFQKIRNSYKQNPQVYQYSADLLVRQQKERIQFIERLASEDKRKQEQARKQRQQYQKAKQIKQTSVFNRQYHENKATKQRYNSLHEIADYSMKYRQLGDKIRQQRQQAIRQQQHKRKYLKQQLQRQINQYHWRQSQEKKMNDKQYLLNKSANMPYLPGLSRDHKSEKQYRIIQNFLVGNSHNTLQHSPQ